MSTAALHIDRGVPLVYGIIDVMTLGSYEQYLKSCFVKNNN